MAILLDTNVAIHLRDGDPLITRKVGELGDAILLSIVTRIELESGVYRDPEYVQARKARLEAILEILPVLSFDEACADAYRTLVQAAGYSRRKLLDRMIAAQALAHRAALVTLNADDFRDVPGLILVDWTA